MYICIYTYLHICVYVNTHIYKYMYTYICMHLPLSSDLYIYIHTTYENPAERRWDHARLLYIGASGYTQTQTHTPTHTHSHTSQKSSRKPLGLQTTTMYERDDMGWLRSVGSIKLYVSFTE